MYRHGALPRRWRRDQLARIELVANADRPLPGSLPTNWAAVGRVRTAWDPLLPGQAVPTAAEDSLLLRQPSYFDDGEFGPGAGHADPDGQSTIESKGAVDVLRPEPDPPPRFFDAPS